MFNTDSIQIKKTVAVSKSCRGILFKTGSRERYEQRWVENGFTDIGIALFYLEKIRDVNDAQIKCKLERLKWEAKLFIPHDIRNTSDHYIKGKKSR